MNKVACDGLFDVYKAFINRSKQGPQSIIKRFWRGMDLDQKNRKIVLVTRTIAVYPEAIFGLIPKTWPEVRNGQKIASAF